jgi:dihydrofolate reductase
MRRIINSTFVSLDGVVNHMDRWHFEFIDDESQAVALRQLRACDALLMGRHTYEAYAGAWPTRDGPMADRINRVRKYVASTTKQNAAWENSTVLRGDLLEEVAKLKQEDGGDILMHGYGPVAKALVRDGLLDELCLWVHPKLAGAGTLDDMVFSDGLNQRLELIDVHALASGVVLLSYGTARRDTTRESIPIRTVAD